MFYRIPPKLLKILLDPKVIKLGVNIRGDALKLRMDFGHKMGGFLEVSFELEEEDASNRVEGFGSMRRRERRETRN